ncbi:MAG: ABC transporter permease, partial [Sarcina sp.]
MNDFINFLFSQHKEILSLLMQHIVLTSISIIICILIGVPLGVLISLIKPLKKPVVLFTNVIQALPTMATLGLLIPMLGIGRGTSILMVVIYCVLPIIKNTYTGLNIVDIGLIEVADSLGLTNMQKLRLVQIPLAIPFIMSGIRISAVLSVGLMTLTTLVGAGGVGYLIFTGIQTFNNNMILVGSIIIVILALIIDYIFEKIEQYAYSKSMCKNKKRKRSITFKLNLIILSIIILMSSIFTYSKSKGETISIGTLNFSE